MCRIEVLALILILKVMTMATNGHGCKTDLVEAPRHTLKKCTQDGTRHIECHEYENDGMDMKSKWPPGPYVIPMSRYGCPESSMHGWREGYIMITWKEPQSAYIQSEIINDAPDGFTDMFTSTSSEPLFSASERHYVHYPSTQNNLKFNFCYKYRSNVSVDVGSWPDESYSILATEHTCPTGFNLTFSNVSLPNITHWESDGYLPDITIIRNGEKNILNIKLCSRQKRPYASSYSFVDNSTSVQTERLPNINETTLYRNWTCFVLIKNKNDPCPKFRDTIIFEETLYLKLHGEIGSPMVQILDASCFYDLKADEDYWLYESRRKNAYSVDPASTSEGYTVKPAESKTGLLFPGFFFSGKQTNTVHFWKVVDLGRTIPVSSVEITMSRDLIDKVKVCESRVFGCFISREKWSFLYFEALSCLSVPVCRITGLSTSLVFKRIMEGRYVTVFHEEEQDASTEIVTLKIYSVTVFTEMIYYDGTESCNVDLNIGERQISASSWIKGFSEKSSYSTGWCPTLDDIKPFIKFVFPITTTIEGLTVHQSRVKIRTVASFGDVSIVLTFSEENNSTERKKILKPDPSRTIQDTQSFLFLTPIHATEVKLTLAREDHSDGLTCFRFEVHGCWPSGRNVPMTMYIQRRETPPYEIGGYISEVNTFGSMLTNIDHQTNYKSIESYKWIVKFPKYHYIKLIFTQIELSRRKDFYEAGSKGAPICNESLVISNDLVNVSPDTTRVIDSRFIIKRYSLSIDTKETQLVLTMLPCSLTYSKTSFKAFATFQEVPTCFSINARLDQWHQGSEEICRHPSMFITSMSVLGFPFENTTERWSIYIPSKRISLKFIEFNIPCLTYKVKPALRLIDMSEEKSFCNIYRPPDTYNSSFDNLTVVYFKDAETMYEKRLTLEGFKLVYSVTEEPEGRFLENYDTFNESKNVALYKPAYQSSPFNIANCRDRNCAEHIVDGLNFFEAQELDISACRVSQVQSEKLPFAWLIDLLDIYTLDYVVLYGGTTVNETCLITLSTGLTAHGMNATGVICGSIVGGRVINQQGIKARFVRIEVDCDEFSLCEVQVYGILESLLSETATVEIVSKVNLPIVVDGEWGLWSAWSDVCYCGRKQYRRRHCDDPKPDFRGRYCYGENISYRLCTNITTPCDDLNVSFADGDFCKEHSTVTGQKRFSSWSDWSTCSSNCSRERMSRVRTCFASDQTDNVQKYPGILTEEKPCLCNSTRLICRDMFQKCYSIIQKYTNWEQARLECMIRNMTLVSFLSLSEMRFVKYLIRQRRQTDGLPNNFFNASFFAHIGLNGIQTSKYQIPVWENGFQALYVTAWKEQEPSEGKCTRMSFKEFDNDNTWESEDCKHQLAEYTVCEYQKQRANSAVVKTLQMWTDLETIEVMEQIPIEQYDGNVNVTVSGKRCNNTLCREVEGMGYIGCENVEGLYEDCSVKLPPKLGAAVVIEKYLGRLSKTFSGKKCQRWDTEMPHIHEIHGNLFRGEGISDAANYCRDVGDVGMLWCFTVDPLHRWEPCLIQEIKTHRKCITLLKYSGTKNTTALGKTCLRWDSVDMASSELDLAKAENYCRDPYNYGFNWCYIKSSFQSETWEPCQIEDTMETISEPRSEPYLTDNFVCSNGKDVIPEYLMCNGKFDCRDKSDETECLSVYKSHAMAARKMDFNNTSGFEEGSFFRCKSGEVISVVTKCDSVIDCLDASDETDCEFNSSGILEKCMKDQFRCDDGDCVHISLVCNHVDDCIDGSDEYCDHDNCFPMIEYQCRTGQCIPLAQHCDAVEQCPDGSDETECGRYECQSEAFHCDGVCKPLRLRCDSIKHCKDGADELLCDQGNFMSCQDVWMAGYRETGLYKLADVHAYCNFDNIFANGELETRINYDFDYYTVNIVWLFAVAEFYNVISTTRESRNDFLIFDREDGSCTQKVTRECLPTFEVVARLTNISHCTCSVHSFDIIYGRSVTFSDSREEIETCHSTLFKNWTREVQVYKPITLFRQSKLARHIFVNVKKNSTQHYLPGPAVCIHDFKPTDNHFPCNVNGKLIPMIQRCIYDIDSSGFADGCTDGSHLLNCETYVCPQNTLKCPGSYCIPHRFLCDGNMQCPDGYDESNCGCLPSRNEILILHDMDSSYGLNVTLFARQFYTQTNIVRMLSYDASKPLQQKFGMDDLLLYVRDIEINASPDIEETFDCSYKVFARNFLNSVYFTNDGLKGIIIIQTSDISKEVFSSIIENKKTIKPDFKIYRVSLYADEIELNTQNATAKRYTDVKVRRWSYLHGVGAEYFSELCTIASKIHCQGGFKCSSSKVCIPINHVCDGEEQCLHGDDEAICKFRCPVNCTCSGFFSNCSAASINLTMISSIPRQTRHLDISLNKNLRMVLEDIYLSFTKMSVLNVSACEIEVVSRFSFANLRNLRTLDLSNNRIKILPNKVFVNLVHLKMLYLRGNSELALIERAAFYGLSLVQELDLSNAKLSKILADTFAGLNLKNIDLANNNLKEIESYAFRNSFIENINFENNDIKSFHKEIFIGLVGLKTLRTPVFKFCCIRPNYLLEQNFYPHQDEFSSCDDLMRHSGLQFMIWLIGIMALLGNVLSIVYRMKYDRERLKLGYGIFVTNLAVADFLMALYLLIIAIADSAFRKRYIYVDDYWRHSIWCTIAGVLSTTSSEASVLFLCLITLDRLIVIKFPFGTVKITTKKATASALCAWIFSFFTALFPVAYTDYFKNEFYSKSGVCIALPLTRDRPPGWAYSLAVFICINFITFILVAIGQLSIFLEVNKHSGIATQAASTRKRDLKVARNLLLVVASDFLCWFPIGVMGMLALTNHPVSGEVYAWAAVFILPVNSALNPLLYTLSAIIGAKSFSPSIDEQSFLSLTRDIGKKSMKCILAGRNLSSKRNISTFRKLGSLSGTEVKISSAAIAKFATKLSLSLDALHGCSLGMNPLDERTVLVGIRNGKLTGSLRISGDLFITNKPEDKQNNIYQFGILLKKLMVVKKTTN